MSKQRIVIALGGNALGTTPKEQLTLVKQTAHSIVALAKAGYEIILGHGNGPQVGMINLALDYAANGEVKTPLMPFAECGAMSQGYIGYHLQQALNNELKRHNLTTSVVALITQVEVDPNDEAFANPSKPIGMFYSSSQISYLKEQKPQWSFVEDAGRGYRRVVPSPKPIRIVERDAIENLMAHKSIVITVGGGGIPVVQTDEGLRGVDAVIDKDKSSAQLAIDINADKLIILTAVDQVYLNFNQANQKALERLTSAKAREYIAQGHFAKGSMLPKIEACLDFVSHRPHAEAIITSLTNAPYALQGAKSTVITAQ